MADKPPTAMPPASEPFPGMYDKIFLFIFLYFQKIRKDLEKKL